MRFELEDTAGTGFRFTYNDETDRVEVEAMVDGEICEVAELTLEAADRWRTGKARFHRASGFTDMVSTTSFFASDDASIDDAAWLGQLGI